MGRGLGAYGLQAAIAECHAVTPPVQDTHWERIVVLYEALGRLAPPPVVELNRAAVLSMARGPAADLPVVDELVDGGQLARTSCRACGASCWPVSVGSTRPGRNSRAVDICGNARERTVLERKLRDLR